MNTKNINRYTVQGAKQQWHVVIGMETHVQLLTKSKIFSPADTTFGSEPNSQVHWLDCALPGTLPVANRQVINHSICLGLAIDAKINHRSIFARKHYFYPDLPKGYQISQFEDPIVEHGKLLIEVSDYKKTVAILRAHMEEDAGKLVHDLYTNQSAVDLNRAGTPLVEIVTEPCLQSPEEAVSYARTLHNLVKWIGICDGNMQEGSFRCDANVSVKPSDTETLGIRCEIKNLNSFKFLTDAINFEISRQIEILEDGGKIVQETRLFDPITGQTRAMRSKEDAHDYRYFPDPDLLTINITDEEINKIKKNMPELPAIKKHRYLNEYAISHDEAENILVSLEKSEFFDKLIYNIKNQLTSQNISIINIAKTTANWLLGNVSAYINNNGKSFLSFSNDTNIKNIASIISLILEGKINNNSAKVVFSKIFEEGDITPPEKIVETLGLGSVADFGELAKIIDTAIISQSKAVAEYKSGKAKALMSIVGAVMKASGGRADATKVHALLVEKLNQN